MATYLLDTNHLSPLVTLNHPLRQRILQEIDSESIFDITVLNITELLYGISHLPRGTQNMAEWRKLRPNFICHIPDEADAENAANLQLQLRQQGWQLATVDALIAAVALRYDLTLLTTDKDFSSVPQLRQENWLSS